MQRPSTKNAEQIKDIVDRMMADEQIREWEWDRTFDYMTYMEMIKGMANTLFRLRFMSTKDHYFDWLHYAEIEYIKRRKDGLF